MEKEEHRNTHSRSLDSWQYQSPPTKVAVTCGGLKYFCLTLKNRGSGLPLELSYYYELFGAVPLSKHRWVMNENDSIMDAFVKVATIAAVLVAFHQYFYKIYPVWSKEKELGDITEKFEQMVQRKSELEAMISDLEMARENLALEVTAATEHMADLKVSYEDRINTLQQSAEAERAIYQTRIEQLSSGLSDAQSEHYRLTSELIASYLNSFAAEIFRYQLNNILAYAPRELDLKTEIQNYVDEHSNRAKSEAERAAYLVLRQFSIDEVAPSTSDYKEIFQVNFYFLTGRIGKDLIERLVETGAVSLTEEETAPAT